MKDVYPVDLEPYIDKRAPPVRGWSIKPLAMFFSRFQEFIFVDSDALFFRDPTTIFDWKRYNMTGAIYFRDRTLEPNNAKSLSMFKSMVPHASEYARNGRFSKLLSVHEGESGVVALDKHRGGTFILLLSLMMNMEPFKRIYYAAVHGDKKSFWMASEALQLPYAWGPGAGGAVGYLNPDKPDSVCGGLLHLDETWRPFWFNSGVVKNKYRPEGQETFEFTHYAQDRTFVNLRWDWEANNRPFCFKPEDPRLDIKALSDEELATSDFMIKAWKERNRPDLMPPIHKF